jgi:VanZ family protein
LNSVRAWIPVIVWATLIFWFSAQSAPPDLGPRFPYKRKIEHMAGYAVFGWLIMRALRKVHALSLPKAAGLAILLVAAYATSDEWHQTFVPNRTGQVSDVVIDTVGGGIALAVYFGYESRRGTKANR